MSGNGRVTKKAQVLGLLSKGATIAEIMAATEWQAHSVRGFISTHRAWGYTAVTRGEGEERTYILNPTSPRVEEGFLENRLEHQGRVLNLRCGFRVFILNGEM